MSFMKGDLLTRTKKLVKGLAKAEPRWLKAMEQAPPATFPQTDGKIQKISLPEDTYIKKFLRKHPETKHDDATKMYSFDPPPARIFAMRVLDLKKQGVSEEQAMALANKEYKDEKRAKKKAYARLKKIAERQGKEPPPDPFPSAVREVQAEEVPYRFRNPSIRGILNMMQEQKKGEEMLQDGRGGNFVQGRRRGFE